MTDNLTGRSPQEIINDMAAQMGIAEHITSEALEELTNVLMERMDGRDMDAEFNAHREATFTYLNKLEADDTIGAVLAINGLDPAGVIALLGSLVLYWGGMLRGEEDTKENLPLGEMARVTFDAAERQCACHAPEAEDA